MFYKKSINETLESLDSKLDGLSSTSIKEKQSKSIAGYE